MKVKVKLKNMMMKKKIKYKEILFIQKKLDLYLFIVKDKNTKTSNKNYK
jgi:hypothetical protein